MDISALRQQKIELDKQRQQRKREARERKLAETTMFRKYKHDNHDSQLEVLRSAREHGLARSFILFPVKTWLIELLCTGNSQDVSIPIKLYTWWLFEDCIERFTQTGLECLVMSCQSHLAVDGYCGDAFWYNIAEMYCLSMTFLMCTDDFDIVAAVVISKFARRVRMKHLSMRSHAGHKRFLAFGKVLTSAHKLLSINKSVHENALASMRLEVESEDES